MNIVLIKVDFICTICCCMSRNGLEVAIAYQRTGYEPDNYKGEEVLKNYEFFNRFNVC